MPRPGVGQVLVHNELMSVDPDCVDAWTQVSRTSHRSRSAAHSTAPPSEGSSSPSTTIPVGSTVVHFQGWREYAVVDAAAATMVDPKPGPTRDVVGVLDHRSHGLPGPDRVHLSRYGDTVFVSSAAGAWSAWSPGIGAPVGAALVILVLPAGRRRLRWQKEQLGYDGAIDHRAGDLLEQPAMGCAGRASTSTSTPSAATT